MKPKPLVVLVQVAYALQGELLQLVMHWVEFTAPVCAVYVFGGQDTQEAWPESGWKLFKAQAVHVVEPVAAAHEPGGHGVQLVDPENLATYPSAQSEQ